MTNFVLMLSIFFIISYFGSLHKILYTTVLVSDSTSTTIEIPNLFPGTTYYFKMKAYNASNTSEYSPVLMIKTGGITPVNPILPPSGLGTNHIGNTQIGLRCSLISNANGYQIYQNVNGTYVLVSDSTSPSINILNLLPGTRYYFKMKAYNATDISDYSSVLSVKTTY